MCIEVGLECVMYLLLGNSDDSVVRLGLFSVVAVVVAAVVVAAVVVASVGIDIVVVVDVAVVVALNRAPVELFFPVWKTTSELSFWGASR